MTPISVMERKKEKSVYRKLLLSDSCCQTNGTSLITPSSSSSGERKSLGKISAHLPHPALLLLPWHPYTGKQSKPQ